jgi:L-cysteine/cystine lyase
MKVRTARGEFPVLERVAYLNAGTFGPLPRRAVDAMEAVQRRALAEGRAGTAFFEAVMGDRQRLREAIAALVGGAHAGVAITTSTTEACNIVVNGLRLGPGDEVVTTDSEHPGLTGALAVSPARIRVARVSEAPAAEAVDVIEREITSATRLVALSHVVWTTGQVIPVERLAGRGFRVLVDGAQSAGTVPVDLAALGCDFYTVSGQKWLCGPDTTGALYVRPDRVEELEMTYPSYLAWEDVHELRPWPDARRFEGSWTPAASVAGLLASLELAGEVGEERFAWARTATERCRELLAERAEVVTEPGQATLVSFRPRDPAAEVVKALNDRGVVVRDLPGLGWVRASCGWWTSEEDLERLADGL